ncbi:MAG: purine-nucleoside/S-methyl-5-thioadenosine phosphorylase / adenosine deaminase [Patescibacteria group bacterium]|nr:purine-nucleoside/S-methyl-5-thioadenosine phosphorylase / adenosine deaminase [Patescibacteria group bacterium]
MLHITFSSPSVLAYTAGKNEQVPDDFADFPVVAMQQTHSNTVALVEAAPNHTIEDCDALITAVPKLQLQLKHADCLPILIYHPSKVIAAVHAGRKGTEAFIIENVLLTLQRKFSIHDSLEIWMGPAICKRCYQIDPTADLHYDLLTHNTQQIRSLFPESNATIAYSNLCTAHQNEKFYSYRKEGSGVPMNVTGIILR